MDVLFGLSCAYRTYRVLGDLYFGTDASGAWVDAVIAADVYGGPPSLLADRWGNLYLLYDRVAGCRWLRSTDEGANWAAWSDQTFTYARAAFLPDDVIVVAARRAGFTTGRLYVSDDYGLTFSAGVAFPSPQPTGDQWDISADRHGQVEAFYTSATEYYPGIPYNYAPMRRIVSGDGLHWSDSEVSTYSGYTTSGVSIPMIAADVADIAEVAIRSAETSNLFGTTLRVFPFRAMTDDFETLTAPDGKQWRYAGCTVALDRWENRHVFGMVYNIGDPQPWPIVEFISPDGVHWDQVV